MHRCQLCTALPRCCGRVPSSAPNRVLLDGHLTCRLPQHSLLPAVDVGKYEVHYHSTVQSPRTHCNEFSALIRLGGGYHVNIWSCGRSHSGRAAVQLRNPQTQRPCSLAEWRRSVPPPAQQPKPRLVGDPDQKPLLEVWCASSGSGNSKHGSAAALGVQLSIQARGRSASADIELRACPSGSSCTCTDNHTFDLL